MLSVPDESSLGHILQRDIYDFKPCRRVEQLRQKLMLMDRAVKATRINAQNKEVNQVVHRKAKFADRLPMLQEEHYVFLVNTHLSLCRP